MTDAFFNTGCHVNENLVLVSLYRFLSKCLFRLTTLMNIPNLVKLPLKLKMSLTLKLAFEWIDHTINSC